MKQRGRNVHKDESWSRPSDLVKHLLAHPGDYSTKDHLRPLFSLFAKSGYSSSDLPDLVTLHDSNNFELSEAARLLLLDMQDNGFDVADTLLKQAAEHRLDHPESVSVFFMYTTLDIQVKAFSFLFGELISQEHCRRLLSIETLGTMGEGALPALRQLQNIVANDKDERVRLSACDALSRIGEEAKKSARAIVNSLRIVAETDLSEHIRTTAAVAVERVQSELGLAFEIEKVRTFRKRKRLKRQVSEWEKSILALLRTIMDWEDNYISQRKIHSSEILFRRREDLKLPPRPALRTIGEHLKVLSSLCQTEQLLIPSEKRQYSTLAPGLEDRLRRIEQALVGKIKRDDGRRP